MTAASKSLRTNEVGLPAISLHRKGAGRPTLLERVRTVGRRRYRTPVDRARKVAPEPRVWPHDSRRGGRLPSQAVSTRFQRPY